MLLLWMAYIMRETEENQNGKIFHFARSQIECVARNWGESIQRAVLLVDNIVVLQWKSLLSIHPVLVNKLNGKQIVL